jgi:hypothetical protein
MALNDREEPAMRKPLRPLAFLLAAALLSTGEQPAAARDDEALTLRVNDAIAKPGGVFAVVLRTYAPRPVRQGQVNVRVRKRPRAGRRTAATAGLTALGAPAQPPVTLLSAVVYSTRGDSVSNAAVLGGGDTQTVRVQFQSPSGTVNAADGPLAVFKMRLADDVAPGDVFDLDVDFATSFLTDAAGRPVQLEPRAATLTVRAPNAPFQVEAEGDEVAPGETAELGFQTFEPFPVSGGQVALRYAPRVARGTPVVRIDPRYGKATFTVERPAPGLLIVRFQSPDRTLNQVPGTIISIDLPTAARVRPGVSTRLILDPNLTFLRSVRGRKLRLVMENGVLGFEAPGGGGGGDDDDDGGGGDDNGDDD